MKTVLILGAGPMQVPLIHEALKMELRVVATDADRDAPGLKYAFRGLTIDATDDILLTKAAKALEVDGVISGGDFAVPAAKIAAALGLPGIPVEVAERTHNKRLMKKRWEQDGVPTPKILDRGAWGKPCVVKPAESSASRGISVARTPEELVLAEAKARSFSKEIVFEEYVEGPEQSVEMFVDERGAHRRLGIVDRFFEGVIETGHKNPSAIPMERQESLYELVELGARSLGITRGPYKADTIWTKSGPMLLELPARLSGGWHSAMTTPLATGQSPMRAALRTAVGLPSELTDFEVSRTEVAICRALFPKPGRVEAIVGRHEAREIPGVRHLELRVKVGDTIAPYENCADRVCYVIVSGATEDAALDAFAGVAATLRIETA